VRVNEGTIRLRHPLRGAPAPSLKNKPAKMRCEGAGEWETEGGGELEN